MRQDPGREQLGRRLTLAITNVIKVGGLAVALNEVFGRPAPHAIVIALAAFMMAGAQISEETILSIASRMFGRNEYDGEQSKEDRP